ncbi:uncharacterized protein [Narcine bancroftii]|uniref:uncharacterized protein n=1 Tax=Narcine bancroftii TaxID=1343680 RepID=UPI003831C7B8
MNFSHCYLYLIQANYCLQILAQGTTEVTEKIEVLQTPPRIEAFEGDSISMQCSCAKGKRIEAIRVIWNKDTNILLHATTMNPAHINRSSSSINETTAELTIENIVQEDSGMYFCQIIVEIPGPVQRGAGNGTKLTVQASHNYRPNLIALFVILVPAIMLLMLCFKQWRKRQRHTRASEVINEENQENEENEENRSSEGSSHWMASSLYESFDYFTIKQEENEETCCKTSNS